MDVNRIVSELDTEIARLQQIRSALTGLDGNLTGTAKRGRPKGSTKAAKAASAPAKRQRKLTPEGRKKIQDAMKRRWAERRKQSASKQSSK
jgi:hypothetical protein